MNGKPQVDFVKSRYGKAYPKKGWGQSILIAFAAIIGFVFFVGGVAAFAAVMLRRG